MMSEEKQYVIVDQAWGSRLPDPLEDSHTWSRVYDALRLVARRTEEGGPTGAERAQTVFAELESACAAIRGEISVADYIGGPELPPVCPGSGVVPRDAWSEPVRMRDGSTRAGTWGRCETCGEALLLQGAPELPSHEGNRA